MTFRAGTTAFLRWSPKFSKFCKNEDLNYNGILDSGEDINGDGQLTPGNIATVENAVDKTLAIKSDSSGIARINIKYPQSYASWTQVRIIVADKADGTENVTEQKFVLDVATEHVSIEGSPPTTNPFGSTGSCAELTSFY